KKREQIRGGLLGSHPHVPQPVVDLRGDRFRTVRGGEVTEVPEQVKDRQIGGRLAVGHTVPLEISQRPSMQAVTKLGEQPRLANARLTHNANHLAAPHLHLRQQCVQGTQGLGAPHKWTRRPCHARRYYRYVLWEDPKDTVGHQRGELSWHWH